MNQPVDNGFMEVEQLAAYMAHSEPCLRGFMRPNLYRMRQFFEAYQGDAIVSPLVRQLPWTHVAGTEAKA